MTDTGYETEEKERNLQSVMALNKKGVGEALLPRNWRGQKEPAECRSAATSAACVEARVVPEHENC